MASLSATLRKAAAAALTVIVLPVLGEFAVQSARGLGLYDNPTGFIQGVFGGLASLAEHPWYPVLVAFVGGLFIGSWFDRLARRSDYKQPSKAQRSRDLGKRATYMAIRIQEHLRYGGFDPSDSLDRIVPDAISLMIDFQKAGLPAPTKFPGWGDPAGGVAYIARFFQAVEPFLRDGHVKEAKSAADHF
jgi:hypothetical protein